MDDGRKRERGHQLRLFFVVIVVAQQRSPQGERLTREIVELPVERVSREIVGLAFDLVAREERRRQVKLVPRQVRKLRRNPVERRSQVFVRLGEQVGERRSGEVVAQQRLALA